MCLILEVLRYVKILMVGSPAGKDKPLSEPSMTQFIDTYVSRLWWVKKWFIIYDAILQVLLRKTTRGALWIYGVFCLFAAAVAMAMPIETKGREMPVSIGSEKYSFFSVLFFAFSLHSYPVYLIHPLFQWSWKSGILVSPCPSVCLFVHSFVDGNCTHSVSSTI